MIVHQSADFGFRSCGKYSTKKAENGMTQQELSEKTGIAQADISKLEHGIANPSLKTLKRLAASLGRTLKVEFAR